MIHQTIWQSKSNWCLKIIQRLFNNTIFLTVNKSKPDRSERAFWRSDRDKKRYFIIKKIVSEQAQT